MLSQAAWAMILILECFLVYQAVVRSEALEKLKHPSDRQ
jgi:hypothetical protein